MAKYVDFVKMHGCGNCYLYVDTTRFPIPDPASASMAWSDVHTGVGSDGLILVGRCPDGAFTMRIFNADGSEARMCGNGARCVGKFIYDHRLCPDRHIDLHTLSGVKHLELHVDDRTDRVERVTVDMGAPALSAPTQCATPDGSLRSGLATATDGSIYEGTFVSVGNPHFVVFTDDAEAVDLPLVGPTLENAPLFPERCNIEFVSPLPDGSLRMRVWERGSGITQACGTGACATAVAAALTGRGSRESRIVMDGGELRVTWRAADDHVLMNGPACTICEGRLPLQEP